MGGLQSEIGVGCSGICKQYTAPKAGWHQSRYATGQKRCSSCGFLKCNSSRCPCCNRVLQTRPKTMIDKLKMIPKKMYQ